MNVVQRQNFIGFISCRILSAALEILSPLYFLYFLWTILCICVTMLSVQMLIVEYSEFYDLIRFRTDLFSVWNFLFQMYDPSNIMQLTKFCSLVFWSFVQLFLICESSERITDRFDKIEIYVLCDWYALPLRTQRILPTVIVNTQEPVLLTAVGSLTCTRDTFKQVKLC